MKLTGKKKATIIGNTVLMLMFVILTISNSTFEAEADGYTQIGYPYFFYNTTQGKLINNQATLLVFNPKNLALDILILSILAILLNTCILIYYRVKR